MARRQSGVEVEALGVLITDAVMRAIVPAINEQIRAASAAAVEAAVGPLCDQIAVLGAALTEARALIDKAASVELVEQRLAATVSECQRASDAAAARAVDQVQPFKYFGPHEAAQTYELNHSVTHRGSLWLARQHVPAGIVPGSDAGAEHWTLAVKCGRDARGS